MCHVVFSRLSLLLGVGVYLLLDTLEVLGQCPKGDGDFFHRIGKTRFYVLQRDKRGNFTAWKDVPKLCASYGLKMAKIEHPTTEAMLGRNLEQIIFDRKWQDTWYWLPAKFDDNLETYVWTDTNEPVKYTNFFYRQPRPAGLGTHVDPSGHYKNDGKVTQCLTLALPLPGNGEYGHQTSWDEKACEGSSKRHAICEAPPACNEEPDSPDLFSEGKEYYLNNGTWIFGERRYIVNWQPRDKESAEKYCASLGLNLYEPRLGDKCLIPYLKFWARRVTSSHFWTNLKFIFSKKEFQYPNGTAIDSYLKRFENDYKTSKKAKEFCVSINYVYEFKNQSMCDTCRWSFMILVPANCNNPIGTICEHPDAAARGCTWKGNSGFVNPNPVLEETATVPFAFRDSGYFRSTYKQKFGSRLCPPNSRMVRWNNTDWYNEDKLKPIADKLGRIYFAYDFLNTYWVVDDEEGFAKNKPDSFCVRSKYIGKGQRILEKVNCNQWYFYLCATDE